MLLLVLVTAVSAVKLSSTVIIANTIEQINNPILPSNGGSGGDDTHSSFIGCGNTTCSINQYCSHDICVDAVSPQVDIPKVVHDTPSTPVQINFEEPSTETNTKVCEQTTCPEEKVCEEYQQPWLENNKFMIGGLFFVLVCLTIYAFWKANYWYKAYDEQTKKV
jgi:hypothetical protein